MENLWNPPGTLNEVGKLLTEVRTPAFVVEKKIVEQNCNKMLETCSRLGVLLRAQTKTHKTEEGALLQTGGTRKGLVCSTLDECEFYSDKGFDDILFGHPFISHHLNRVDALVRKLKEFHVMIDSESSAEILVQNSPPKSKKYSVFLKVDCGKGRAGVWHEDIGLASKIVLLLSGCSHVTFKGLYVHCGDTYGAKNTEELDHIRDTNISRLLLFMKNLTKETGVSCPTVGIGSTPSCQRPCDEMSKLSEIHPGNYAFLDIQQHILGSCSVEDIAGSVMCTVIGHYRRRNQLLVDCGFTALTKQGWGKMESGYGVVRGFSHLKLSNMDQEHGFIEPIKSEDKLDYSAHPIGSFLFILPYHSCATAAMYSKYLVVEDNIVTEEWRPTRGW